jgi:dipeptidyl aminopeptidase/acylaminoacyl peptidase
MRRLLLFLVFAVSSTFASDFAITSRTPATFPLYSSVGELRDFMSEQEYRSTIDGLQKTAAIERVLYRHDAVTVSAYVATPKGKSGKLPVIVFNRGSYVVPQPLPLIARELDAYARAGYLVIAPTLRGSDGTEGKDELGGGDVDDLAAVVHNVAQFGSADTSRIYMAGESRGGIMTYFAIARGWPIRAAAVWGAITDVGEYLARVDKEGKLAHTVWPDFNQHKDEILRTRSAIQWPDQLKVPLLIMHGGADPIVPATHSLRLASELQQRGAEYQLIIYAGDRHVLDKNRERRDDEVLRWFGAH